MKRTRHEGKSNFKWDVYFLELKESKNTGYVLIVCRLETKEETLYSEIYTNQYYEFPTKENELTKHKFKYDEFVSKLDQSYQYYLDPIKNKCFKPFKLEKKDETYENTIQNI